MSHVLPVIPIREKPFLVRKDLFQLHGNDNSGFHPCFNIEHGSHSMCQSALESSFIKSFLQNELSRMVENDSRPIMVHLSKMEGYLPSTVQIMVACPIFRISSLAVEIHGQWKRRTLQSTKYMPSFSDVKGPRCRQCS